ncbi:cbb3-type cytochrome oxidase assembly protein CcoS [Aestuariirhabdus sp. Z084]|uniref:cbb3-type cytochrome oxidase assembly protein CcoS n=1 Tax=Aestuariirhabdus haliotis TaxID=2918751 RepID=UPI00201B3C90|nr:cbb3-type cytochrome oxidase assembly protein CcoS [Aestuariirhabdus haliotis]MCL6415765.1 cbb3-type cytochrome oxidase assembly protein CcoS [Aestuariirhabdus haliotis]MCL6419682.1 cbb3-type cytochrome oxidase assembly protein CcoS [Aestuariirhabdus haliotis]
MESIYLLIPIALLFVAIGVWIFFWAVDDGQFDDLEGPAHSILFDEEPTPRSPETPQSNDTAGSPSSTDPAAPTDRITADSDSDKPHG